MSSPRRDHPSDGDTRVGATAGPAGTPDTAGTPDASGGHRGARAVRPDRRVVLVHRVAAVVVALVIAAFGILGLVGGLGFFDTEGRDVAGLSTNGLLSTISLVTAAVLLVAAVRGGRFASTTMIVIGVLFLVSAFVNLALLDTPLNLLAFRLPNVFFSIGAGLVLLVLGTYGRVSGKLPADNPYAMQRRSSSGDEEAEEAEDADAARHSRPRSAAEHVADREMAEAARAVAAGRGSPEQSRRITEMHELRTQEERRRAWMSGRD